MYEEVKKKIFACIKIPKRMFACVPLCRVAVAGRAVSVISSFNPGRRAATPGAGKFFGGGCSETPAPFPATFARIAGILCDWVACGGIGDAALGPGKSSDGAIPTGNDNFLRIIILGKT